MNVTLFGESAGAIDATRLMTSPLAAGLFKRVISESGPAFESGQTLPQAEGFGNAVSDLALLAPGDTAGEVAGTAGDRGGSAGAQGQGTSSYRHHRRDCGRWVLPGSSARVFPAGAAAEGRSADRSQRAGTQPFRLSAAAAAKSSRGAGPESGKLAEFAQAARPFFGSWTNPVIAIYLARILANKTAGLDAAANDLIRACPIGAIASLTSAAGQHVFVYRFDRSIPGKGEAELRGGIP